MVDGGFCQNVPFRAGAGNSIVWSRAAAGVAPCPAVLAVADADAVLVMKDMHMDGMLREARRQG